MTEFLGEDFLVDFFGGERVGKGGYSLLVLDRAKIDAMGLPGNMIYRWAHELGKEVRDEARHLLDAGGHNKTGRLWESTKYSAIPVAPLPGTQVNVRATANHAIWFIKGTPPHEETTIGRRIITYQSGPDRGKQDWGFMRFFWFKGGFLRYEQRVWHPGWGGFNYLNDAKLIVLDRRGISAF